MSFNKVLEIYQIRWSIEVFFKESKQLLGLGKTQSVDFDVQISETTIKMIQYIFLSLKNRVEKYDSYGGLFRHFKDKNIELKLHERLVFLIISIIEIFTKLFDQIDLDEVLTKIINDDEAKDRIFSIINQSKKAG